MVHVGIFCAILSILLPNVWYIYWSFGIFFPVWVCSTEKNLATLINNNALNTYSLAVRVTKVGEVFATWETL
jgi:hypothetical protein